MRIRTIVAPLTAPLAAAAFFLCGLLGAAPLRAAQDVDPAAVDAVFADIGADMPGCAVGVYRVGGGDR
jgi:hypothetical protein